jgi:hypothetical protein
VPVFIIVITSNDGKIFKCVGCFAVDYEDMDERKLAILEPPYARNQNDGKSGMQRFLSKM